MMYLSFWKHVITSRKHFFNLSNRCCARWRTSLDVFASPARPPHFSLIRNMEHTCEHLLKTHAIWKCRVYRTNNRSLVMASDTGNKARTLSAQLLHDQHFSVSSNSRRRHRDPAGRWRRLTGRTGQPQSQLFWSPSAQTDWWPSCFILHRPWRTSRADWWPWLRR